MSGHGDRFPSLTTFLVTVVLTYAALCGLYFVAWRVNWEMPTALALARFWHLVGLDFAGIPLRIDGRYFSAGDVIEVLAAYPRVVAQARVLIWLPVASIALVSAGWWLVQRSWVKEKLLRGTRVIKH